MVSFIAGLPAEGSPLVSAEIRNNFTALNNRTDKVEVKATIPASTSLLIGSGTVYFTNRILVKFSGQKLNLGDLISGIKGFTKKGYFKDVLLVLRPKLNLETNRYEALCTFIEGPEKASPSADLTTTIPNSSDLPLAHFVVRHNGLELDTPGQIEPITQTQITDVRNYLDTGGVEYYSAVVGDRRIKINQDGSAVEDAYSNIVIEGKTIGTTAQYYLEDIHPIQQAIDQLANDGGTIILRKGIYQISSTITITSNITLIGEGSGTIIQMLDSFQGPMFKILGDRISLRSMRLIGTLPSSQVVNDSLIKVVGAKYCTISDCFIESGVIGLTLYNSNNNIISNNYLINNNLAISITGSSNNFLSFNQFKDNLSDLDALGSNTRLPSP